MSRLQQVEQRLNEVAKRVGRLEIYGLVTFYHHCEKLLALCSMRSQEFMETNEDARRRVLEITDTLLDQVRHLGSPMNDHDVFVRGYVTRMLVRFQSYFENKETLKAIQKLGKLLDFLGDPYSPPSTASTDSEEDTDSELEELRGFEDDLPGLPP